MRCRMSEPDLWRISLAIKFRRLQGALGKVAAEYDDRRRLLQRIFFNKPFADAMQDKESRGECEQRGATQN